MVGAPEVFFLPMEGDRGQRLCVHSRPKGSVTRGAVVYVHPFAEEMNKARRMAALQSRAFADAGYAVLQIDLLGCGDSSGDFDGATWQDWVEDVVAVIAWMRQRHPEPLWLWGLRASCLLVSEAASRIDTVCNLLFWQPVPVGKATLQQFLRLRAASDMADGQSRGSIARLRACLDAGEAVDIAGYRLNPALAIGLDAAALRLPARSGRIVWIEVSTLEGATLRPASASIVEEWRVAGRSVATQVISGAAFWQTGEIEEVPELIAATLTNIAETVSA